jgi:hypothetical protein
VHEADDDDRKIGRKVKAWWWHEAALGPTSRGPNRSVPRPQRLLALQCCRDSASCKLTLKAAALAGRSLSDHDFLLCSCGSTLVVAYGRLVVDLSRFFCKKKKLFVSSLCI